MPEPDIQMAEQLFLRAKARASVNNDGCEQKDSLTVTDDGMLAGVSVFDSIQAIHGALQLPQAAHV